jgi:hypothetical protein
MPAALAKSARGKRLRILVIDVGGNHELTIAVVEQAVGDIGRNMREAAGGGGSIWIECHRSFPVYPAE